ncbi:uncharacterized protein PgNI_07447 [Pyricularia grisea]|uniref:Uncharacterized protein n=1 Tax=Pyricularia grisea TaxID=148305 RepID=A0A6P8B0R0_PYRGI|nr:uncharacterized protein PgNI_07447 [Pyricularia grisea]TLD08442.1 hypothetical protein PgNI_07447 [Pyricularia grisea]
MPTPVANMTNIRHQKFAAARNCAKSPQSWKRVTRFAKRGRRM